MGRVLGWFAGILVTLAGLVVLVLVLIDWNALRGPAEELLSDTLGREVELGALSVRPGLVTRVHVENLTVAGPDWGKADELLVLDEGEVGVRLLALLRGDIDLTELVLREPRLALEKDAEGRRSWDFSPDDKASGKGSPLAFPEQLVIDNGKLSYRDAARKLDIEGEIQTVSEKAHTERPLSLTGKGTLEGRPIRLQASGSPVRRLQSGAGPYSLELTAHFAKTKLQAEGSLAHTAQADDLQISFVIEGPTLADVFPALGVPLPDTPPYRLTGELGYDDEVWHLDDFDGRLGDSALSGSASVDHSRDTPLLTAQLRSSSLDFDDLAGLVGAPPDPDETASARQEARAAEDGVFPDKPLSFERLNAMNMDVSFEGDNVRTRTVPLEKVRFHLQLSDGKARVDPLRFRLGGGEIEGVVRVDARQDRPTAVADFSIDDIDLKPLFTDTRFVQQMGGRFLGHLFLKGSGRSLHEVLADSHGSASLAMHDGSISGLMLEVIGLDVAEALSLVVSDDARVAIRCGRADMDIEHGTGKLTRFLVDTTDTLLVATGSVDLAKEQFDIYLEAREKDFSLIDASAPVHLHGSFDDVAFDIGDMDAFPLFNEGDQKDISCTELLADAIEHGQGEGRDE